MARAISDPYAYGEYITYDGPATEERIAKLLEDKYKDQLKRKEQEIQILKDENEFLNKRIEHLKEYGSLFKEYHEGIK